MLSLDKPYLSLQNRQRECKGYIMLSRLAQTRFADVIVVDSIALDSGPAGHGSSLDHLKHFTRLAEHYYYCVLQLLLLYLVTVVLPNCMI